MWWVPWRLLEHTMFAMIVVNYKQAAVLTLCWRKREEREGSGSIFRQNESDAGRGWRIGLERKIHLFRLPSSIFSWLGWNFRRSTIVLLRGKTIFPFTLGEIPESACCNRAPFLQPARQHFPSFLPLFLVFFSIFLFFYSNLQVVNIIEIKKKSWKMVIITIWRVLE